MLPWNIREVGAALITSSISYLIADRYYDVKSGRSVCRFADLKDKKQISTQSFQPRRSAGL